MIFDPSCLDERLPQDHAARVIWAVVGRMDLSGMEKQIEARGATPGRAATDPRLLVGLLLLGATEGIGSCRWIAELCGRDIAYQWMCGGVGVNYHTLADFRVGYEKELDQLLSDLLAALVNKGLLDVQRISQDGVRVRASAGRSSFRRGQTLEKLREEAWRHVVELKKQSDDPALSQRIKAARQRAAQDRLDRIEEALALLPAAQAAKGRHTGKPSRKQEARVSTTDPQAHRMKTGTGAILPSYNIQLATDTACRAIVGVMVGDSGSDGQYATPMRQQVQQRTGREVKEHLVDGGFFNKDALEQAHAQNVAVYMPLPKPQEGKADPSLPKRGDGPGTLAWRKRMSEEVARRIYKQRASTSETVNADLTTHRGLPRLLVRGLSKVKCMVMWSVLAYNVMHFASALTG
jgi:transposase